MPIDLHLYDLEVCDLELDTAVSCVDTVWCRDIAQSNAQCGV